jgi:hypothetical protein
LERESARRVRRVGEAGGWWKGKKRGRQPVRRKEGKENDDEPVRRDAAHHYAVPFSLPSRHREVVPSGPPPCAAPSNETSERPPTSAYGTSFQPAEPRPSRRTRTGFSHSAPSILPRSGKGRKRLERHGPARRSDRKNAGVLCDDEERQRANPSRRRSRCCL